eukprot:121011-Pelagomonas_calceolata.AAC.1
MQEETAKRNSRASRFNIPEPQGPKYAPDQDELAKAARAKKFGVQGYEPAASAMMDMGGCSCNGDNGHDHVISMPLNQAELAKAAHKEAWRQGFEPAASAMIDMGVAQLQ